MYRLPVEICKFSCFDLKTLFPYIRLLNVYLGFKPFHKDLIYSTYSQLYTWKWVGFFSGYSVYFMCGFLVNQGWVLLNECVKFWLIFQLEDVKGTLTIGLKTLYFCVAVVTENPKHPDFVCQPWRILLYIINILPSARTSATNRQLYNLFILFFFRYSITLCCVSMMRARLSGSYSSNKYCSFSLSIFSSFFIYRIASSMCAVGLTMYILSKQPQ